MEFSYTELKQMDVVCVKDGRNLGKVCDLVFSFPEGRVCGFYVTGCKGFRLTRPDIFVPVQSIVRIGEDVIITDVELAPPGEKPRCRKRGKGTAPAEMCGPSHGQRRSYDEYE